MQNGDYEESNNYLNKYVTLKDSLQDDKNIKTIASTVALYENEKTEKELAIKTAKIKDQENLLLKRKTNTLYVTLGFIAINLVLFMFFAFYQRKVKKSKTSS
ncbi:hypothetical protein [Thalassobellus citreus]|uniref:hypothetical protein n=1 Tax=Thalassobellus citreus TaxID=3367752 RepID=UPI0037B6222D